MKVNVSKFSFEEKTLPVKIIKSFQFEQVFESSHPLDVSVLACTLETFRIFHLFQALGEFDTSFFRLKHQLSLVHSEIGECHWAIGRTEWLLSLFVAFDEHVVHVLLADGTAEASFSSGWS